MKARSLSALYKEMELREALDSSQLEWIFIKQVNETLEHQKNESIVLYHSIRKIPMLALYLY